MERQYSIAIYPPEEIIGLVKSMKNDLAAKIGWFHSKNAVGHITICEFEASEAGISKIKLQLMRLCDGIEPVKVCLNEFGSYSNGAFYIAPDVDSKNQLKPIMQRIQKSLIIKNMYKSNDPHLSIARKLTPEQLSIAKILFQKINMDFVCKNLVLRQFDEIQKQFIVIDVVPFNSNRQEEIQGTLF